MMSLTPDTSRKVGMGLLPSPSPFYTPRPERRRPESRGGEFNSNRQDREKEVNVQVLLRCRPLSDEEQRMNVAKVIACNEQKREVTVLQSIANKQVDRVFTFDKVFGPKAQQRSIYDQAIAPIVNEVLEGFNCTVFAYGQTGTGKTYTMEGRMRNKGGDLPAEAGVIPRAVRQIFDSLDALNADYSMKVTFLELYNEEITDLLAPDPDNSRFSDEGSKKPISLMEDGKGCVVVRGLEEEVVYSANDIYSLLERGASRRRTADTLLNKRSSRSHSVFSITILVKEAAVMDEEVIKCGKLNLVDLAGSENISRSGARDGRAREAGEINKSLLTLGRVINALVEHSTHIPYRDSKLTRLLRDSLGGKTKTCIIATISPSAQSLEETLSTLDYAYRAKNIKNKPEANQKMSKSVLLKDLYLEIERMKEDVRAAREKNGVYVPHERYAQDEAEKKARIQKIEQLENDLNLTEKQVDVFRELYLSEQEQRIDLQSDIKDLKVNLETSNRELLNLQESHMAAISELKEKERIISKLLHSENSLIDCAKDLRNGLQTASDDINLLFAKLDQKDKMEAENRTMILTFGSHLDRGLKDLHKTILASVCQQQQHLRSIEERVQSYLASKCDSTKTLEAKIKKITETYNSGAVALKELANRMQSKASDDLEQINVSVSSQMMAIEQSLATLVLDANEVIKDVNNSLNDQKRLVEFSTQQQEEGLQRSLCLAREISEATNEFFIDICQQASQVITALEESQIKRSYQLANFEKSFKEEAAREEKQALESISAILAALTSKKTSMVSEAARNIYEASSEENKRFLQDMLNMQKISSDANYELGKYVTRAERHFVEDTFSMAESKALMDTFLHDCSKTVEHSRQQWENAESCISNLTKSNSVHIESILKETAFRNNIAHEELLSVLSATGAGFDARVKETMVTVNDSLMRDQENKKEMDFMTTQCMDQLKFIQGNHGECVSNIRSKAENFLTKDYQVDKNTAPTPRQRAITVPSLASIEEMRSQVNENLQGDNNCTSKWGHNNSKILQNLLYSASHIRAPFTDLKLKGIGEQEQEQEQLL